MKKSKNKIYAFLICIIAGLLFTILFYNFKFKYLISRNIIITITYCILYLVIYYKFRLTSISAAFFTFITPFLIDFSVVFTNSALIPVRFPFATTFLMMGIFLGYFLQKSIKHKTAGIVITLCYFFLSWHWIIPYLIHKTEEVKIKFKDDYFSTNILNQKGDTLKLKSLTTKALIIDYFFVGCPPCEEKRKMLEDVKSEIPNDSFMVLLICDGAISSFKNFQEYCVKNPPKKGFQILYDYEKNIAKYFPQITGYPFELVFKNSKLIKSYYGFSKEAYDYSKKMRSQTINKFLND